MLALIYKLIYLKNKINMIRSFFKKKDPENKATPAMLGDPANFKFNKVTGRYEFPDDPKDEKDENPLPPTIK